MSSTPPENANDSGSVPAVPPGANYSVTGSASAAMAVGQGSFASLPDARHDITLCFDGVTITRGKRTLLDHVSGIVHGGKLTALVSSCGGRGDYHLLNVLASQHEGAGLVIANGSLTRSDEYRRNCALIDEEMTSIDRLTVEQNLMCGSEMRTNASIADHEARLRIVVEWLELEEHLARQVQSCSPDVRRRVSIARELMLHPAAIFIDSAVEGLATYEARRLLARLRLIAVRTGAVVCVSMLQPRWALLELADHAIVLEGACVAYAGTPPTLLTVAAQGLPRQVAQPLSPTTPERQASSAAGDNGLTTASPFGLDAPEGTLNALYRIATNPHTTLRGNIPHLSSIVDTEQKRVSEIAGMFVEGTLPLLDVPFRRRPPWMPWKFILLVKYGLLQVRNRLLVHVLSTVLILLAAVLIGIVYQNQGSGGQAGMQNRVGIIFFLVSSTFLHNLLFVESSKKAYLSFQRHRVHGYYDCFTYLVYWLVVNALQRFVGIVAFMAIVYALAKVHGSFDLTSLQTLVGVMALVSFASALLVWLVCCVMPNARYAHFVLFTVYAVNVILAGIVLNLRSLPEAIQDLSFGSFIRLGYESAVVSEFKGQSFGCSTDDGHHLSGGGGGGSENRHTTTTAAPPATTRAAGALLGMDSAPSMAVGLGSNHSSPHDGGSSACFTGSDYLRFLGFDVGREGSNMAAIGYATIGMAVIALIAMWLGRARW